MVSYNQGNFTSASRQFASGEEAASAKKGGIEATLSDSNVLEIRLNGSVIKIDPRTNLISVNGEAARPMQDTLESERIAFNRYASGAKNFGIKRTQEDLTIHETFGNSFIGFGQNEVMLTKLGGGMYGIALNTGGKLLNDLAVLPRMEPKAYSELSASPN